MIREMVAGTGGEHSPALLDMEVINDPDGEPKVIRDNNDENVSSWKICDCIKSRSPYLAADTVTIEIAHGWLTTKSQIDDYAHRGPELEEMSL
jgi:hypothetical protein